MTLERPPRGKDVLKSNGSLTNDNPDSEAVHHAVQGAGLSKHETRQGPPFRLPALRKLEARHLPSKDGAQLPFKLNNSAQPRARGDSDAADDELSPVTSHKTIKLTSNPGDASGKDGSNENNGYGENLRELAGFSEDEGECSPADEELTKIRHSLDFGLYEPLEGSPDHREDLELELQREREAEDRRNKERESRDHSGNGAVTHFDEDGVVQNKVAAKNETNRDEKVGRLPRKGRPIKEYKMEEDDDSEKSSPEIYQHDQIKGPQASSQGIRKNSDSARASLNDPTQITSAEHPIKTDGMPKGRLSVPDINVTAIDDNWSLVSDTQGLGSFGDSNNNSLNAVTEKRRVSFQDEMPDSKSKPQGLTAACDGNEIAPRKLPSPRPSATNLDTDRSPSRESPALMSEGLRKYRRRSQLMISSDIPTDVPLKNRHIENDLRIKDTLAFIKRRVSLQEYQCDPAEESTDGEDGPRRAYSSLMNVSEDQQERARSAVKQEASPRSSKVGGSYRDPVQTSPRPLSSDNHLGFGQRTDPNFPKLSQGNHSRQASQESVGITINVEKGLSDEEIDEYLGNIPSNQRRYGMPPLPQDMTESGKVPQYLRTQSLPSPDNARIRGAPEIPSSADGEDIQPYVPIKKQRFRLEDHETAVEHPEPVKEFYEPSRAKIAVLQNRLRPEMKDFPRRGSNLSNSSVDTISMSSLADQHLAGHIRKDSIALFSSKLYTGGRLRRLSQVSLAELDQLRKKHKEMTREEILKTYRLHFFVCLIFLVTLISVSLAWYYKNMATEHIYATQAIFFDPRSRELTLTDPNNGHKIHAKLGQDMPDWQLPLHCPIVMGDNPHVKECVWKNHAILRIVHFRDTYVQCYNVSWESLHAEHVPYDCFNIQDGVWYGPSNQSQSMYPIRGEFQLVPKDYTVRNNGIFSSVVDFYWLSSTGVGLYLQPDNPLQIVWGSSGLCVLSNFTGPFYHQENSQTPPYLNYTLCNGVDPVQTNAYMQKMLVPREGIKRPDDKYFLGPYWSLRKAAQDDDTGSQIEDLAGKLVDFGFQDSKIILDGSWEKHFGDLKFNPEKFQNFSDQVDTLKQSGFDVVVPISPYFELTSDNFYDGVTQSMFVLDAGGQVPGLTNFEGGIAAILDVLNAKAVTWMENKTKTLSDTLRQKNFRLTYGSKAWLPYKPHFSQPSGTPNMFRKAMTEMFHDHDYPQSLLIVEHTSSSRHVPALIPVLTDVGVVDGRNCLVGAIETALTLGLMGYPFLLLEGVVEKPETRLSEELFLRWLQLAAVFPAHQYTAVPWNYGNDIINMATNVTSLHEQLVMAEMNKKYLMEEVGSGLPILRPIWWLDPSNETLHKLEIKDQFLIGNELLVAPVLCEGVQTRDVYFPPGNWLDPNGILSVGPKILLNQTVPRDTLLFYRKAMVTQ